MKNVLYLIAVLFLLSACSKEKLSNKECDNLLTAISSKDNVELTKQINNLCYDLSPQPTTDDEIGHEENLNTLISRLETNCDIEAELVCNACIKTFPARSEIKVTATLLNGTYVKTIHIATPEENNLTYASIHD